MMDLGNRLRDADPVAHEPLPIGELDRMITRLRSEEARAASQADDVHAAWGVAWQVVAAGLVCAAIAGTVVVSRRDAPANARTASSEVRDDRPGSPARPSALVPVRHLQFSTPEGIRVFWTFNPDFEEN